MNDMIEYPEGVDVGMEAEPMPVPSPVAVGWFDNLVDDIDQDELDRLGDELNGQIDGDEADREEYMRTVEASIKIFGTDGGVASENTDLKTVHHILTPEIVMHGVARIKGEAMPAEGALKAKIIGEIDDNIRLNATAVEQFCNWQLYEDIEGYSETLDIMFTHCLLSGTAFLKLCYDPISAKPVIQFIPVEHLIVASDHTKTLAGVKRFTHQYFLSRNEYNKMVAAGMYADVEGIGDGSAEDSMDDISAETQGTSSTPSGDGEEKVDDELTFYDVYTYASFDGIDPWPNVADVDSPYIITLDKASSKIVSVRRNWAPADIARLPLQHIVEFRLFPGVGFYGDGFYQKIGGLDKAATSSLRALLDAAGKALNPPALVSGAIDGGHVEFGPGDYASIARGGGDDIRKNVQFIPTMQPDPTLASLIEMIEMNVRRFGQTTDINIGDASKGNMPVGTTMALIEESAKTTTGIHQRMHRSLKRVYKILNRINFWYQPDVIPFATYGMTAEIQREAFNPDTIDIVPVSDPNISSMSHRITMLQEVLGMALQRPDILDVKTVYQRMLVAMKVPNVEELFLESEQPPFRDAITENRVSMAGEPLMAYDMQDDEAHIKAHLAFFNDPTLADNPFGEQAKMVLAEHIADHISRYYWKKASAAIGIAVPLEAELDPQTEAWISMEAAKLSMVSPLIDQLPELAQTGQDPAVETAIQLGRVKLELAQAEAKLKHDAKQQQIIDDRQSKAAILQSKLEEMKGKAVNDMQIENQKLVTQLDTLVMTAEKDREIAIGQARLEWQLEAQKQAMEMQMAMQAHENELQMAWEAHRQELVAENQKLQLEKQKLEQQIQADKEKAEQQKKLAAEKPKTETKK